VEDSSNENVSDNSESSDDVIMSSDGDLWNGLEFKDMDSQSSPASVDNCSPFVDSESVVLDPFSFLVVDSPSQFNVPVM
jgi:hypothetical protein